MTTLRSVANLFALTSSILLLSSCTQYRYDVTYEKCNGQTGSVSYTGNEIRIPRIEEWQKATPHLQGLGVDILNVCDFSYQRNPIE